MKTIMRSKITQVICKLLTIAMLATIVPGNITARPAYAQAGARLEEAIGTKKVAVADFVNDSNAYNNLIAENATAQLINELEKKDFGFEVVVNDQEEIKAALDKLNIRTPMSNLDAVRLAEELEVDGILEGFITGISVKGTGDAKTAKVDMTVQYVDKATGEVTVGASASGSSTGRAGYEGTDEDLVIEALQKALYSVADKLCSYKVPTATVYMTVGSDNLILNTGVRGNIRKGMRMVVTRAGTTIGYIEVINAGDLDSTAKIIQAKIGIKPEDTCTAVFSGAYTSKYASSTDTVTGFSNKNSEARAAKSTKLGNAGMVALGVAAALGIAALFSSGGSSSGNSPSASATSTPGIIKVSKVKGNMAGKVTALNLYRQPSNGSVEGPWVITSTGNNDMNINVFNWDPENEGTQPTANVQYTYTGNWTTTENVTDGDSSTAVTGTTSAFKAIKLTRLNRITDLTFGPTVFYDDVYDGIDTPTFVKPTDYDTTTVSLVYRVTFSTEKPKVANKVFNLKPMESIEEASLSLSQCKELAQWISENDLDEAQASGVPYTCQWKVDVRNELDSATQWVLGKGSTFQVIESAPYPPDTP
ncbi:MAG: hypothetical protein ILO36_03235 [Abditibacteriota bacterium]|nr:hypothetical protein [Abditibacteriota bacterium]